MKKIKLTGLIIVGLFLFRLPNLVNAKEVESNDGIIYNVSDSIFKTPYDELNDGNSKFQELEPTFGDIDTKPSE